MTIHPLPIPISRGPCSAGSYVFLYGHDASGGTYDDSEEDSDENDDDEDGESLSDNDSLLSGLDGREELSDDDDYGSASGRTRPTKGKGKSGGHHANGGGGGVVEPPSISKRKTMFAEMRRESMAGSLQPAAKNDGRRPRRDSSGDSDDEDLERMEVPREEDEDYETAEEDYTGGRKRGSNGKNSSRVIMSDGESGEDGSGGMSVTLTSDEEESGGESSDDGSGSEEGGGAQPRFLIYFWAGARAKKSDWVLWKLELAKSMLPEWQKVRDYVDSLCVGRSGTSALLPARKAGCSVLCLVFCFSVYHALVWNRVGRERTYLLAGK